MTTPAWQAPRNGMPGDRTALLGSSHINQLLSAHAITSVYQGAQIVTPGAATSTTGSDFYWISPNLIAGGIGSLNNYDVSAPFTLPGGSTAVGRVQVAMLPVGNGADVKVTLCPDSSGLPNTSSPLASSIVPASHITHLGAGLGLPNGGPLATAFSNILQAGPYTQTPWNAVATSGTGLLTSTASASYGQYLLLVGGQDSVSGNSLPYVYAVPLTGGGAQTAIPQPSLPLGLFSPGVAATSDTIVVVGGYTGSAYSNGVYTAGWNSSTGVVSSWSAQATLPVAMEACNVAVYQDSTVYVFGGYSGSALATVYVGSLSNGQIQSWKTSAPLPNAAYARSVGIVGNILVVAGGLTAPGAAAISNTYFAVINSDGSLGPWQTGPSMPVAVGQENGNTVVTDSGLFVVGGIAINGTPTTLTQALQSLTVTADGVGAWQVQQYNGSALDLPSGGYANGDGTYTLVSLGNVAGGFTNVSTLYTVPFISVPLPASGLTAGNTYHLVFHQIGGDINNYVQLGEITTSSAQWLYSTRYSGGWGAARTGLAILANVFDETENGQAVHLWQDPDSNNLAAATATLVHERHGLLLGACEATGMSQGPLNSNPTFTTGVSPWTVHGGTFTQSSAQTHGGFPFSGLLTPDGVTTQPYALSEQMPVHASRWYQLSGWFYSPPGWSQVEIQVNWFDQGGNPLTFNNWLTSLTGGTWLPIFLNAQAHQWAAYATLQVSELGTPPGTALLYVSDYTLKTFDPETLASVAAVNYAPGTYFPPIGISQLN